MISFHNMFNLLQTDNKSTIIPPPPNPPPQKKIFWIVYILYMPEVKIWGGGSMTRNKIRVFNISQIKYILKPHLKKQ